MIALGASYPIFAHIAVLSRNPLLITASIGLLMVLVLLPALRKARPLAWIMLPVVALCLYAVAAHGRSLLLLFLPPILINGFMAWVFGRTLESGGTPLIERAIVALHGTTDDVTADMLAYARRLTVVWACLFVALTVINLVLAVLATPGGLLLAVGMHSPVTVPLGVWSLFANVLNYLIVGALFIGEYWLRRRRFPQQSYRGFLDFTRRLAGVSSLFRPIARE
jgi:uncharacterized membrane protein